MLWRHLPRPIRNCHGGSAKMVEYVPVTVRSKFSDGFSSVRLWTFPPISIPLLSYGFTNHAGAPAVSKG